MNFIKLFKKLCKKLCPKLCKKGSYMLLKKLAEKDCYNFISPYGLGDTMMLCGYKKAWEEKSNGEIHFIIKPSHEIIMKMFSITNYTIINFTKDFYNREFPYLVKKNSTPKKGNLYIAHPLFHKQFKCLIDDFYATSFTFITLYKKFLNLDKNTILDMPIWYPPISKDLEKKIKKMGEIKDIVLLLPEANSMPLLKEPYWNELVKSFSKNEILIQNALNPDNLIKDVPHIDLSLEEMIALAINCKKIYSLRSGFCDLISYKCNNLNVLYTSDIIKQYSLKILFNSSATEEFIRE